MARPLDLSASGLSCNCTIVSGQHVIYTHGPTINPSTGHLHILAVPCQIGQLHYLLAASLCSTLSWEGGWLAPHRQTATQSWLSTCQTWRKTSKPKISAPRRHKRLVANDLQCLLQFRSISFNLWGTEDFYQGVRRRAVEHIRSQLCLASLLSSKWKA